LSSIAPSSRAVIRGIDTHKYLHVAAIIDTIGVLIDTGSFSTTRVGYRAVLRWMRTHGGVRRVGIEGTGSYGDGMRRENTSMTSAR